MSAASKPLANQISESLPAKRKRGRPRKDGDITRNGTLQSTATPIPESMKKVEKDEVNLKDCSVSNMTGQNVYGVIDGSFDAGYFITVRIGNNGTPLRGVVFLPGKFTPITAANDVAPQAKMYQRTEIPNPEMDYQNRVNDNDITPRPKIVVVPSLVDVKRPSMDIRPVEPCKTLPIVPRTSSSSSLGSKISIPENQKFGLEKKSQSAPPIDNLRMVEQDEVMQVFEVSTPLKERKAADTEAVKDVSQSSSRATASNLPGNETMNQEPQFQQNAVKSGYVHHIPSLSLRPLLSGTQVFSEMADTDQETRQRPLAADYLSFPSESQNLISRFHPSPLDHSETQDPTFELHETPVVAQLQSVPGELQAMESELQPTDLFHNELKSSNFRFHKDFFADQSHPTSFQESICSDSKFQPGHLVHNELKNPNLVPPQHTLINEQLDFTVGMPKSPTRNDVRQESNFEPEAKVTRISERHRDGEEEVGNATSNDKAGSLSALRTRDEDVPLKLELGESTLGGRLYELASCSADCTTHMDFVLSDVVQPTEPRYHQSMLPP
ncbi:uncharacterized protein Fot_45407 [Forsythia ovata]|uniref:AT hook motif-containing protein n=1 Tax=Forsythia ovata TaxID=205694 RepID=A0ABD1R6B9_9LAMI